MEPFASSWVGSMSDAGKCQRFRGGSLSSKTAAHDFSATRLGTYDAWVDGMLWLLVIRGFTHNSAQLPIIFNPVGLTMPIPGLLDKQFLDLALQAFDPISFFAGDAITSAGVDIVLANPFMQGLWGTHPILGAIESMAAHRDG